MRRFGLKSRIGTDDAPRQLAAGPVYIPIYPCNAWLDLEIDRRISLNAPGSMLE